MIRLKKSKLLLLVSVLLSLVLVQLSYATVMNLSVHGGEEVTQSLNLAVEDHVLIKFNVIGGQSGNTLDFYLTCPNGTSKITYAGVGSVSYNFICDEEGEYVLRFSNLGSSEDKLVSLDYEVQHYVFGVPQMLFLTVIIVLVCVAAVAVFIFMGKQH